MPLNHKSINLKTIIIPVIMMMLFGQFDLIDYKRKLKIKDLRKKFFFIFLLFSLVCLVREKIKFFKTSFSLSIIFFTFIIKK